MASCQLNQMEDVLKSDGNRATRTSLSTHVEMVGFLSLIPASKS